MIPGNINSNGVGDPTKLPNRLRTILGNRHISTAVKPWSWGQVMLRAFGFREPSPDDVDNFDKYVSIMSDSNQRVTGYDVAQAFKNDIVIYNSTGTKEEFGGGNETVEILLVSKSKEAFAIIPSENRVETVKQFLKSKMTQSDESFPLLPLNEPILGEKRTRDVVILSEDPPEKPRLGKIPILAEFTVQGFQTFAAEVQGQQAEWPWSRSICFSITEVVEKMWKLVIKTPFQDIDNMSKLEFLRNLDTVVKRSAGSVVNDRIIVSDPILRWEGERPDLKTLQADFETRYRGYQGNKVDICRELVRVFSGTVYFNEVRREMQTITRKDLEDNDTIFLSFLAAQRAILEVGFSAGASALHSAGDNSREKMQIAQQARTGSYATRDGAGTNESSTDFYKKIRGKFACFKCGESGHKKEDCPKFCCYFCGEQGHISTNCDKKKEATKGVTEKTEEPQKLSLGKRIPAAGTQNNLTQKAGVTGGK